MACEHCDCGELPEKQDYDDDGSLMAALFKLQDKHFAALEEIDRLLDEIPGDELAAPVEEYANRLRELADSIDP